jgi:hypothetical protein
MPAMIIGLSNMTAGDSTTVITLLIMQRREKVLDRCLVEISPKLREKV